MYNNDLKENYLFDDESNTELKETQPKKIYTSNPYASHSYQTRPAVVRETVVSRSPPQYGSYQNTTSPAYTAGYSYRTTPVYDSYQTTLSQPHTQYVKWTPNNVSTWGPTLGEGI